MPNGVAMDPLAPTALAVSNEFMDRIGSGLTLLRDHGKKVQKVEQIINLQNSNFLGSWGSLGHPSL